MSLSAPVAKLDTGFLPYVTIQLTDQTGPLKQLNKLSRRNHTTLWMNPANQCFSTTHNTVRRYLWLNIKAELSAL